MTELTAAFLARWAASGAGRTQRNRVDTALVPLADLVRGRFGYDCLDPLLRDPYDQMSQHALARAIEERAQHDAGFARQVTGMLRRVTHAAESRGYPSRSSSSGVGWAIALVVVAVFAIVAYVGLAHQR